MAVNIQRGGERTGEGHERHVTKTETVFEHRLAYCKPACSMGLSSNGLSFYINAIPVNLGYSEFTQHS